MVTLFCWQPFLHCFCLFLFRISITKLFELVPIHSCLNFLCQTSSYMLLFTISCGDLPPPLFILLVYNLLQSLWGRQRMKKRKTDEIYFFHSMFSWLWLNLLVGEWTDDETSMRRGSPVLWGRQRRKDNDGCNSDGRFQLWMWKTKEDVVNLREVYLHVRLFLFFHILLKKRNDINVFSPIDHVHQVFQKPSSLYSLLP